MLKKKHNSAQPAADQHGASTNPRFAEAARSRQVRDDTSHHANITPPRNLPAAHKNSTWLIPLKPLLVLLLFMLVGFSAVIYIAYANFQQTLNAQNAAIMSNLSAEAIDAFKQIRLINYYKYNANKSCWKMLPNKKATDPCTPENSIQPGFYSVRKLPLGLGYKLDFLGESAASIQPKPLVFSVDTVTPTDSNGTRVTAPNTNPDLLQGFSGFPDTLVDQPFPETKFFRTVQVQPGSTNPGNELTLTVNLRYQSGTANDSRSTVSSLTNIL